MSYLPVAACVLTLPALAQSTWYVDASAAPPGLGTAMQPYAEIDFAVAQPTTLSGDTILIAAGTYAGPVDFAGKSLELVGTSGAAQTTVDAGQSGSCLLVQGIGTAGSRVSGLTLTGGGGTPGLLVIPGSSLPAGGGLAAVDTTLELVDCVIEDIEFFGNAGGILAVDSHLVLERVIVRDNGTFFFSDLQDGGGAWIEGGRLTATDCTFERNFTYWGSAGMFMRNAQGTLVRCRFAGNDAGFGDGGGILAHACSLAIIDSTFASNRALDAASGGGLAASMSVVDVRGTRFMHGEGDDGGAVFVRDSTVTLEECTFRDNRSIEYDAIGSAGRGGALAVSTFGTSNVHVRHSQFLRNEAVGSPGNPGLALGGGVHGVATLERCTFLGNVALDGGGAAAGGALLSSCLVWGNVPDSLNGTSVASWSDIEGGWPGTGNIDLDPLVWDLGGHNGHLTAASPCIDAGDPAAPVDPDGSRADMGALPFDSTYRPLPTRYCPNPPHSGGCPPEVGWLGRARLSGPADFRVHAIDLPGGGFVALRGSFSAGSSVLSGGTLCLGTPDFVLGIQPVSWVGAGPCPGAVAFDVAPAALAALGFQAGDVLHMQMVYRDPGAGDETRYTTAVRALVAAD